MKMNWTEAAYQLNRQGKAYVLVTVVGVSGSTPRNSGTKMVISNDEIFDTIGGGHLEHKTIKYAHKLLSKAKDCQHLEHFKLGVNLGQCCGGSVTVLFECFSATAVNIMLFGAGHVGQALIPVLATLPCQVTWVDSRKAQFPENMKAYNNVSKLVSENPEDEVANMPANSYYIVMTHNHQMDFEISQKILKCGDFNYLGLIASTTKWRRFQLRYKHHDIDEKQVQRMNCPIGLSNVAGKLPTEIAVSVVGEIIERYQQVKSQHEKSQQEKNTVVGSQASSLQKGIEWKQLKQLLNENVSDPGKH